MFVPTRKGKVYINLRVVVARCKGKELVAELRKKGSVNLTEDGSEEGRYPWSSLLI